DIPVAVDTIVDAFQVANDPLERYFHSTPDRNDSNLKQASIRLSLALEFAKAIHDQTLWTINGGESIMISALDLKPKKPVDKLIDVVFPFVSEPLLLRSKQQKKRVKEFRQKMKKSIDGSIGDRIDTMLAVSSLVTAPAHQGHGYATRLVQMVTAEADKRGWATWLGSSNVAVNTEFYNSLGFFTVDRIFLGDSDRTWKEPPVPADLMVREPKATSLAEKAGLA
ncbi:hypothetical protein PHLCEN_2v9381, partial [Hermanssonia centrifuga]